MSRQDIPIFLKVSVYYSIIFSKRKKKSLTLIVFIMAKQNAAPHRILPEAAKPFISIRPEISELFVLNHF